MTLEEEKQFSHIAILYFLGNVGPDRYILLLLSVTAYCFPKADQSDYNIFTTLIVLFPTTLFRSI